MSRRSQRIKTQLKMPPSVAVKSSTSPEPDNTIRPEGRPAAKARRVDDKPASDQDEYKSEQSVPITRKSARVVRRRRGKLHQMLEMPLDVMMEICSNVELREVLYLSRLSKAFREVFISRRAQFIWKSAALNTPGLPPCPKDLNIIAYASLMFDAFCHNCNGKNCYFVYWGCRKRICNNCFAGLSINERQYLHNNASRGGRAAMALFQSHRWNRDELLPPLMKYADGSVAYYIPDFKRLVSAWEELPQDDLDARRKTFLIEQRRSTGAIMKTIPALQEWFDKTRNTRADELSNIRQARQDAIVSHLTEDWQVELDYLKATREYSTKFLKLPEVRKSQALTPRIWNSIKGPIIEYMRGVRKIRLHKIYMETLKKRVAEVDPAIEKIVIEVGQCHVTSYECKLRIPEIFDLVDPKKTEFDLKESLPTLRTLIQDYLKKRDGNNRQELMVALRNELKLSASVDPFVLAVGTYFLCSHCDWAFRCQEAIRHVCDMHNECPRIKSDWMSNDYFDAIIRSLPDDRRVDQPQEQLMWSVDNFRPSFNRVASVVKACGFDVKTATVEDLDNCKNLRLLCLNHKNKKGTKLEYAPIMTWRTAAFESTVCCTSEQTPSFERATDKQVLAVKDSEKAVELAEANEEDYGRYTEYACAHCSEFLPRDFWGATNHIREVHNIERPEDKDRVEYDRSEKILPEVYLVPTQRKKQRHALAYLVNDPEKAHLVTFYKFEKW